MFRRILLACTLSAACVAIAGATVGGPDLARPLGWDRSTKEAYFAIDHYGESGNAATIVRLRLSGPDTVACEPLWWSGGVLEDSTYKARFRRLMKKLSPLKEEFVTTVPGGFQIIKADTLKQFYTFARYHVSARFSVGSGSVEAVTYRDPSLRMVRYYFVPELGVGIGVFSFIGIPYEVGYEVQLPARVPADWGSRILLEWKRGW